MKHIVSVLSMVMLCTLATSAFGQDLAERLDSLEKALNNQARTIEEQQKTINALKEELARQKTTVETQVARQTPAEPSAKEEPSEGFGAGIASKVGGFFGGSALTNPYISAIVNTYGYSSNLNNEKLSLQGIPGFTTQGLSSQRGFNLDSVELMIFAPVDPYFNLYINTPITDSGINVEEAYAVTTFLPEGFQLKGGGSRAISAAWTPNTPMPGILPISPCRTGPSSGAKVSAVKTGYSSPGSPRCRSIRCSAPKRFKGITTCCSAITPRQAPMPLPSLSRVPWT